MVSAEVSFLGDGGVGHRRLVRNVVVPRLDSLDCVHVALRKYRWALGSVSSGEGRENIGEGETMIIEGEYDVDKWFGAVRIDGVSLDPRPSQKIYNHSPDGFAWSYGGSGPAQLALAILLAAGLSASEAIALYQRFKAQFIVPLPRDSFRLDVDVLKWVAENRKTTAMPSQEESER